MMNDGGPAYPVPSDYPMHSTGITLRDYFAAAALQGLSSTPMFYNDIAFMCMRAYTIADAMLEERAK